MNELILTKPGAQVGRTKGSTHLRALRLYPCSPGKVHLQVRAVLGRKTPLWAGVELSQLEVIGLRDYLTDLLNEHFHWSAKVRLNRERGGYDYIPEKED